MVYYIQILWNNFSVHKENKPSKSADIYFTFFRQFIWSLFSAVSLMKTFCYFGSSKIMELKYRVSHSLPNPALRILQ